MSAETVPICDGCWRAIHHDRDPVRLKEVEQETCFVCHERTISGIYVRAVDGKVTAR